jgi:hypothetical protein
VGNRIINTPATSRDCELMTLLSFCRFHFLMLNALKALC